MYTHSIILILLGLNYACALFGSRLLRTRQPATGPCTLNDDGMKCDENGYYKLVQCDSDSCFCVTPHTALIAYDTNTDNPKTAPKCGTCLVYLEKLFANGDPPENSYIPKCDVGKGDFEPLQCDSQTDQCYCVDVKTGRQIQGSRRPLQNTTKMSCMDIDFSIDSLSFPTFIKPDAPPPRSEPPVGRQTCLKNRDAGHKCNENKTLIRYWFDAQTFLCLPFEYKGCGGNENSFKTKNECYSDCVLADYSSCPMQSSPARMSNGQGYICPNEPQLPGKPTNKRPGPKLNEQGCPKGYICQMGAFFGFCCEEDLSNRYQSSFKPTCKNKKHPLLESREEYASTLIGKSCSDKFCPASHTCENNEFFAYCCPK